MKPHIEIMGKRQAIESSKMIFNEPTIIISISPFTYVKPKFAENESILDILYLFFDDIDHDAPTAMTAEQAKEIADFVNKHKDDVEQIIVHCDAGVSRSADVLRQL